jgi:hypothetical protein
LNHADFRNDRLGELLGLRQRQQIGEIAAWSASEGQVLAEAGPAVFDDSGDLVEIGKISAVGADESRSRAPS